LVWDAEENIDSSGSALLTQFVPPMPSIMPPNPEFCMGFSDTLSGGTGPGWSYEWSSGVTTPDIIVSTAGVFGLTVTDANGCNGSDQVTVVVNSNPTPVMEPATKEFCEGSSLTLRVSPAYDSILWSTGVAGQSITVQAPGFFQVTVTDANGCLGTTSGVVSENQNPQANFKSNPPLGSTLAEGKQIEFTDESVFGQAGNDIVEWIWNFGDGASIA